MSKEKTSDVSSQDNVHVHLIFRKLHVNEWTQFVEIEWTNMEEVLCFFNHIEVENHLDKNAEI